MENFHIYKYGKYDKIANIKMKVRNEWPSIEETINNFFSNH